ncbi:MAG: DUF3465 domain-containing protein [Povalibacter sp.]
MKKILITLLLLGSGYWLSQQSQSSRQPDPSGQHEPRSYDSTPASRKADDALARAFEQQRSNVQVEGEGEVIKILNDDNQGSRHQRFLLRISADQTVLIAHNVDLARRIDALRAGDRIAFKGEYEWNNKGGVIHWTHHDPSGRHEDGWLEHNGRRYQ